MFNGQKRKKKKEKKKNKITSKRWDTNDSINLLISSWPGIAICEVRSLARWVDLFIDQHLPWDAGEEEWEEVHTAYKCQWMLNRTHTHTQNTREMSRVNTLTQEKKKLMKLDK